MNVHIPVLLWETIDNLNINEEILKVLKEILIELKKENEFIVKVI